MDAEEAREKLARDRRFVHMAQLYQFVGGRRAEVELPVNQDTQPVLEGFWSLVKFRVEKLKREAKQKAARKQRGLRSSSASTSVTRA